MGDLAVSSVLDTRRQQGSGWVNHFPTFPRSTVSLRGLKHERRTRSNTYEGVPSRKVYHDDDEDNDDDDNDDADDERRLYMTHEWETVRDKDYRIHLIEWSKSVLKTRYPW